MIKQRSNLVLPKPLYGIGDTKDEQNLYTGELTHRIGKIEFDGTENFLKNTAASDNYLYYIRTTDIPNMSVARVMCDRVPYSSSAPINVIGINSTNQYGVVYINFGADVMNAQSSGNTPAGVTEYLSSEYQAGHPMTIWYVLSEPTTETVTISESVSGIVEGYLIQNGTPTPQNPIYPTSCESVDMWNEVMYRQYGFNETLSPIPSTVFSQGDGIDSSTVYGNTVQDGTPAPDAPVSVNGVGDRTGNLFDDRNIITIANLGDRYGVILPTGTYSIYNETDNIVYYGTIDFQSRHIACEAHSTATVTLYTDPNTTCGFLMALNAASQGGVTIVSGSTPPSSYEPYGCILPIKVDNTTITVPLNTTQSIRYIQKLVLTGDESYTINTVSGHTRFGLNRGVYATADHTIGFCTHYQYTYQNLNNVVYHDSTANSIYIFDDRYTSTDTFKQYLQQQYASGTPVTVYYVLATPQTSIVNEPLMKIGNYVDSVSYTSNIPTTSGQNEIDVDTQIKPSKIDITYNAFRRAKSYKNNRWILRPSIDWSQTFKISDLQSTKIKEMEGEYIGYNIHT